LDLSSETITVTVTIPENKAKSYDDDGEKKYGIKVGGEYYRKKEKIKKAYNEYYGITLEDSDFSGLKDEKTTKESKVKQIVRQSSFTKETTSGWYLDKSTTESKSYSGMTAEQVVSELEKQYYFVTKENDSEVTYYSSSSTERLTYGQLKEEYELRRYTTGSVEETKLSVADVIRVIYTNEINTIPHADVNVTKKVTGDAEAVPASDTTYSFVVYKGDQVYSDYYIVDSTGGKASPSDISVGNTTVKGFTISGANLQSTAQAHLEFTDPNLEDVDLKIEEVNTGNADSVSWSDNDGIGKVHIESGKTEASITCTNAYFNKTLTISKILDPTSTSELPDSLKRFMYEVTFKDKDENALSSVKVDPVPASLVWGDGNTFAENMVSLKAGGILTFTMLAGDEVKFTNLPTGSSYKVTESALVNDYYKDSVTGHAATPSEAISYTPTTREFNGSFTNVTADTKNHMVGYTNKVIRAEGTLKITKQLESDTDKSKEPLTFTFEIYDVTGKEEPVDYETCKKFYASVTIPANANESNVELKVPAGKYVVKELKTLRYDLVDKDSNPKSIEVKKDSSEEVIFVNKKVSDGYFSSVSTKVNTVNEDGQGSGFPLKNDRKYNSQNALQKVVAWLGSDNKENGDE
ncbi:MAG: DUF5979 domain-containing protein, partial [Lachnospiraceae bacterium]|nr:DUF5979 domain-containing protein [Lachnospiraceae bacterium]